MPLHYLIIGAGIAGLTAAQTIRKFDRRGKIQILSAEPDPPYARYLLPEVVSLSRNPDSLHLHSPSFFRDNKIDIMLEEPVEEIDAGSQYITSPSGKYPFDKLLIATGGRIVLPRASLLNVKGVFVLRRLADARAVSAYLQQEHISKVAVVGAGIVGLKVACALARRGMEVTIVEKESRILPRVLDPESQAPVARAFWENGFEIALNERFREFLTSGKHKSLTHLVTYSGRSVPCQAAIMCPGVRPDLALAKTCGLKTRKGISVDNSLQTGIPGIYAAGDVIETPNIATGRTEIMPLWKNALEQGAVAGLHMAGQQVSYEGAIWKNKLDMFGLNLITIGQSRVAERMRGIHIVSTLKKRRGIRLVFSRDKLIGATLLNYPEMADVITKIVQHRIPAWHLKNHLLKGKLSPSLLFDSIEAIPKMKSPFPSLLPDELTKP